MPSSLDDNLCIMTRSHLDQDFAFSLASCPTRAYLLSLAMAQSLTRKLQKAWNFLWALMTALSQVALMYILGSMIESQLNDKYTSGTYYMCSIIWYGPRIWSGLADSVRELGDVTKKDRETLRAHLHKNAGKALALWMDRCRIGSTLGNVFVEFLRDDGQFEYDVWGSGHNWVIYFCSIPEKWSEGYWCAEKPWFNWGGKTLSGQMIFEITYTFKIDWVEWWDDKTGRREQKKENVSTIDISAKSRRALESLMAHGTTYYKTNDPDLIAHARHRSPHQDDMELLTPLLQEAASSVADAATVQVPDATI